MPLLWPGPMLRLELCRVPLIPSVRDMLNGAMERAWGLGMLTDVMVPSGAGVLQQLMMTLPSSVGPVWLAWTFVKPLPAPLMDPPTRLPVRLIGPVTPRLPPPPPAEAGPLGRT